MKSLIRGRIVLACLVANLLSGSAPARAVSLEEVKHERPAAVASLPEIARVGAEGDTILILRGSLTPKRAGQIEKLVRAIHREVKRRFLGKQDRSGLRPVDVCVFESTRSYRRFVSEILGADHDQSDLGFYSPYRRLVAANLERGLRTLRHEMVHPLLEDDARWLFPHWMMEGLASLFDRVERTRKKFRFLPDHRLADVRAAIKSGTLPSLDQLAASDDRDVYGTNYRLYYGMGRYLLMYLDQKGKLDPFILALRKAERKKGWQVKVLSRFVDYPEFLTWIDTLK
jgi:hypothetical protein